MQERRARSLDEQHLVFVLSPYQSMPRLARAALGTYRTSYPLSWLKLVGGIGEFVELRLARLRLHLVECQVGVGKRPGGVLPGARWYN